VRRTKPLERRTPLRRFTELVRSKPLPRVSEKRKALSPWRNSTRAIVLDRDRGCVARHLPGVPCGTEPGQPLLIVHELRGGADRFWTYLDPDWCVALCPVSHRWAHDHPIAAYRLGLLLPTGDTPEMAAERRAAHEKGPRS
jgi:hypothetical protein